jgi:1-acyl-sn-glycerol-3-phosphate acyltransferase
VARENHRPGNRRPESTVSIPGTCSRDPLVGAITRFLAQEDVPALRAIRALLEHEIDRAGPEAIARLGQRLATTGADWSYYPNDPLARRIHHVLADRILSQDPLLFGTEHLDAVAGTPLVIVANHLSYSDANLLEVLFHRAKRSEVSDRLTVVTGPKVYSDVRRRFSSLCFGTIKTPQSRARSSDEAVMNAREVAVAARRSIEIALERLQLGDAVLVFAEGSRSRSAALVPVLAGVSRYLDQPEVWVLPVGIAGSEALFPIAEDALKPVRVAMRVGPPIRASDLCERARGDRQLVMDAVGVAVAALLPERYRGVYGDETRGLDEARQVWSDVQI